MNITRMRSWETIVRCCACESGWPELRRSSIRAMPHTVNAMTTTVRSTRASRSFRRAASAIT
jgi:hypothetical protein